MEENNKYRLKEDGTYECLLEDDFVERSIDVKKFRAINAISIFTQKIKENQPNYDYIMERIEMLKLDAKLDFDYDIDRNEYTYFFDENKEINFQMISEEFGIFFGPEMVKELESSRRQGNCHRNSMDLCLNVSGTKVHTGWAYDANFKFLHSIVELPNGKIVDWNKNLIMDKDDYYYLSDFEPVAFLSHNDLKDDFREDLIDQVGSLKVYLTSRDEIIDDLKRRKAERIDQIGYGKKRPKVPNDDGMGER